MSNETIIKNLKTLMNLKDANQVTLCNITGTTSGAVSSWMTGRAEPRTKHLQAIAEYYGITVDDLVSDQFGLWAQQHGGMPASAKKPTTPRKAYAPLLGRVHAGDAQEPCILDKEVPIPFEVWEGHKHGYFLEVEGNCMSRVYPEGCRIFIDPDMSPSDGSIAVVRIDGGEYVMRRLRIGSSTIMLSPESWESGWEDIIPKDGQIVEMVGTVVWFQPAEEMQ